MAASVARYALCKPGMEGEGEEAVMRTIGRVDWLMGRYDTKGDASHPMHGRPAEPAQCAIYTGKYSKRRRVHRVYGSTVVKIAIPPLSFKPVPLSLSRSPLL